MVKSRVILGALLWATFSLAQVPAPARLDVAVYDSSHSVVPGAKVEVRLGPSVAATQSTGETGHALFPALAPTSAAARYTVVVTKDGFDAASAVDVEAASGATATIELTLVPAAAAKQSVEVHETVSAIEAASTAPTASVSGEETKALPSRPATVSDALPLIPGVARSPTGGLQLSGSGEHRGALLVNSADVTDPATGQFGLTVPIDSVENLNFYQTSFLAEYGRFTAGLVSVETRRGGDKWKWELNDPLPEFNIRSWQLRGLRTATPRVNFEGPLIAGKLYFSEGFEYEVRKTEVLTLPFPNNQKKQQGINTFSQLDWVVSDKHLLTATVHVAPQHLGFVNLDYFHPEETTPDARTHNYTGTVSDKLTIGGGLWENTLSATKFDATVWSKGALPLVIEPQGDSGNYFASQGRDAERYSWLSAYSLAPHNAWGSHNIKVGSYLAGAYDDGSLNERPIELRGATGQLLERIDFTGGLPFSNADTEFNLYAQDHWIVDPHLAIDIGLRSESQEISDSLRFAPRLGLSWSPYAHWGTVLRAGVGVFYDHVPLGVYSFDHFPERVVSLYDANGNLVGPPVTYVNGLGEVLNRRKLIYSQEQPGNFSPRSTTGTLQVEQPVTRFVRLRAGYMQSVSSGLVILDSTAPDLATNTAYTLLSGSGTSRYRQVEITARVRTGGERQLMLSYVRSRTTGDLNDFANYIGSFPNAIIHSNQVATAPTDLPNRFLAWGNLHLPRRFGLAPVMEYRDGFPYIVTDALQHYVGVPNTARYPNFLSLDARVWKDIQVNPKYAVRFSVSSFNLTNHDNPQAVHFDTADPQFGQFFGDRHRRFTLDFDFLF
jgi:hypothetical protein